jgi:hypothetical protein
MCPRALDMRELRGGEPRDHGIVHTLRPEVPEGGDCDRCHGSKTIWDGAHVVRCPDCGGTGKK